MDTRSPGANSANNTAQNDAVNPSGKAVSIPNFTANEPRYSVPAVAAASDSEEDGALWTRV